VLPALPALASSTPTLTSVAPLTTHAGRQLTLAGTGLEDADTATLAGVALTGLVPSATSLTVTVPLGTPVGTTGPVHVTTASGGDVTSDVAVTVAAPPQVTGLSGAVGDHAAVLTWTAAGTGTTVVRDVTGVADPLTPSSGRSVPVSGLGARDTAFTNTAPATYAAWAVDSDGTPSDSPATVTVSPVPAVATALSIGVSRTVVLYGTGYAVVGRLTRGGQPSAGRRVDLLGRAAGTTTWSVARRLVTDANGGFKTGLVSTRTAEIVLRYGGDAFSAPVDSAHRVVAVQPWITAGLAPPVVVRPEPTVLSGRVPPGLPGAVIRIQRGTAAGFVTVQSVLPTSTGAWSWRFAITTPGSYVFRAVLPAAPSYRSAVSWMPVLRVETRDLQAGMTGDDVLALKRRLAGLHYLPGSLTRYFGYDLTHAVMAFQKVERLPVTGRWTRAERVRMGHPTAWRVRYPAAGRAVEVDITRQVLVLSEGGRVSKIVDVSTGTERLYTYRGDTDVAHTPRGRFVIERQIDGIRISNLGALYRPSYFHLGWAIHGSASVPSYPASHGCVRITNGNTDRLFPLLVRGTPVALYDE
jgi:hypothetical protein